MLRRRPDGLSRAEVTIALCLDCTRLEPCLALCFIESTPRDSWMNRQRLSTSCFVGVSARNWGQFPPWPRQPVLAQLQGNWVPMVVCYFGRTLLYDLKTHRREWVVQDMVSWLCVSSRLVQGLAPFV